jgi:hypothetical protein
MGKWSGGFYTQLAEGISRRSLFYPESGDRLRRSGVWSLPSALPVSGLPHFHPRPRSLKLKLFDPHDMTDSESVSQGRFNEAGRATLLLQVKVVCLPSVTGAEVW